MAQIANNDKHQSQITAGINGRKKGHKFEKSLTEKINHLETYQFDSILIDGHNYQGDPAKYLLKYIINSRKLENIKNVKAYWTGGLATSNNGDIIYTNDILITKSKSDIIIDFYMNNYIERIGVSVKSCNKKTPTNEQIYFTTATAFCNLLRANGIMVSTSAEKALKMFCGDIGFRPIDDINLNLTSRLSTPERWFWEELPKTSLKEWANIFQKHQFTITKLLLQKAYSNDFCHPSFLIHQKHSYNSAENCPIALFSIDEICDLSCKYSCFITVEYKIRKGSYKNDPHTHQAPRFGFIQMQRGGQKQHPTQLQFNLKAGYFNLC